MRFVIGVDGGGTTTDCICLALDGTVLAASRTGPSNYLRMGLEAAMDNVREAIQRATAGAAKALPAQAACICLAGIARPGDKRIVVPALTRMGVAETLHADIDAEAALAGAHALGPGVVVTAGTGAIAYGRNARGEKARVDGWGPILGDEGSGYWIGVQTLRAVMRAFDGREESTALTPAVLNHFGLDDETELIPRLPLDRTNTEAVAHLAAVCAAVGEEGDATARNILNKAGVRLADAGLAALRSLGLDGSGRVAALGGVMNNEIVRSAFERCVAREGRGAQVVEPVFSALVGAGLMAVRLAGVAIDHGVQARVSETLRRPEPSSTQVHGKPRQPNTKG